MLAVDGPGPLAKLMTQRQRRSQKSKKNIETLQFTPGTELMEQTKHILCHYAACRTSHYVNKRTF